MGAKYTSDVGPDSASSAAGPIAAAPRVTPARPSAELDISAERRQLTIMFCDLVGSTTLASRLDPEDTREVIGACLSCVADVVTAFGGFVAHYAGDAALIHFGYPEAHEDDAERAIHAALGVVEAVSRLNLMGGYRPRVRIGIATGQVVVGALMRAGSGTDREVSGGPPYLAARLQTMAEPNAVIIDAMTRRLAGGLFDYRDLGPVELKGFAEPVPVWQVLGARATESRFEAHRETGISRLVGRETEAERLRALWRTAKTGAGQVVLLSGEPGIGKSRLTSMLLDEAESPGRLRYFCLQHRQGAPFHPFIAQIERVANFARDESAARRLEKLDRIMLRGPEHAGDLSLIADLLSLGVDDRNAKPQLTPQKHRERTMAALVRQVELLSRRGPLLAVIEDAHWIDPSSRDLVNLAVERIARLPVLLVITFRPEFQPPWSGPHVSALALGPLPPRDCVALVENVAGHGRLPSALIDDIVARTDGVPLFVEELTKAVLETRQGDGDRAVSGAPPRGMVMPATLQGSLTARLDRLGPAKAIVQIGAAIGREFSYELLAAVTRSSEAELRAALARLIDSGLASCRGTPPDATYLFKHALVQDAAYRSMLRDTRRTLHERIVDVFERDFPATLEQQPDLLAHHCTEAGLTEKAVAYWFKAGQQAMAQSAIAEAIARLRRGLEVAAHLPEGAARYQAELDLNINLGHILRAAFGYTVPAVVETYERARVLCDKLDGPPQLLWVLYGQWTNALMLNDQALARRRVEEMLKLGEARDDDVWRMMGCRAAGVTAFARGEFVAAREQLERALGYYDPAKQAIYATLTVEDAQVTEMVYLSWVLLNLGEFGRGRRLRDEALTLARARNHAYTLAHALNGFCYTELLLRAPERALRALDEVNAVTDEHGISYYRPYRLIFRGLALSELGEAQESVQLLERGIAAYRATGTLLYLTTFYRWLAAALGQAGDPAAGLRQLDEATRLADTGEAHGDEGEIHRVRGDLLAQLGDAAGAEASYRAALDAARRRHARLWELHAATALARLLGTADRRAEARALLAEVSGKFDESFDTPDLVEAKALLDRLA